jgi:hypothetical protein
MTIVGGLDVHGKQITFDYVDTDTVKALRVWCCLIRSAARRVAAEAPAELGSSG